MQSCSVSWAIRMLKAEHLQCWAGVDVPTRYPSWGRRGGLQPSGWEWGRIHGDLRASLCPFPFKSIWSSTHTQDRTTHTGSLPARPRLGPTPRLPRLAAASRYSHPEHAARHREEGWGGHTLLPRLKLPHCGHQIWRADPSEKTLMPGEMEGKGEGGTEDEGLDASLTQWTWLWANSGTQ